jgi:hypothetical protein
VIAVIYLALLISVLPVSADTAQPGRTTAEVNFREGPNVSSRIITRLASGAEVLVLRQGPGDWYRVMHGGRSGFVHKNYIRLESGRRFQPKRRQLAISTGIVLAGIGIILMASVLAPDLLMTATALVVALVSVAVFDLLFQLGVLYSFFCVSLGALALVLVLRRKRKNRAVSADERFRVTRKAA